MRRKANAAHFFVGKENLLLVFFLLLLHFGLVFVFALLFVCHKVTPF
jgi:hypothetical protein